MQLTGLKYDRGRPVTTRRRAGFRITRDCIGCGLCRRKCPWQAVIGVQKKVHLVEPTLCRQCGTCWYVCPQCAVENSKGDRRAKAIKSHHPKATIDREACVGCQNCLLNCEQGAISYERGLVGGHCRVDGSLCIGCASCLSYCPNDCIAVE